MAINVAHYELNGNIGWGVVADGGLTPLVGSYETTGDFMRDGRGEARTVAAAGTENNIPLDHVTLLSPVTQNQQYVCQGTNYVSHLVESGIDPEQQTFNMIFRKASSCIAPPNTDVVRPAHVSLLDYELELGLVFGKKIDGPVKVTWDNLADYVGALVVNNDISARDVQLPQWQFYKGKSYRTFGPTGPWLTLIDQDDVKHIAKLRLQLFVNNKGRQDALADDLFFQPPETLTELSGVQDFSEGDLLATGTPGGVAMQAPKSKLLMFISKLIPEAKKWEIFIKRSQSNPSFLQPGDVIQSRIATEDGALDLGTQTNKIVQG
ncbi:MAG: fumarylacetoacetate hydrolase family protein [Parvibaculaceae bacterium]|nr:fumarylacetoacetate hydrolase family protein [Parvibaculaceae bacterium]